MVADQKRQMQIHVRWMIARDMPEVLDIEAESFEYPWMEDDFVRCLRGHNTIGMVAEHEEKIIGYMIYDLKKKAVELLNFAVAAERRRKGVGSQMLGKLKAKLSIQRRSRIVLRVTERNLEAHFFFRSMGFRALSVEREYFGTGDDAYLMVFKLRESTAKEDDELLLCRGEDAADF